MKNSMLLTPSSPVLSRPLGLVKCLLAAVLVGLLDSGSAIADASDSTQSTKAWALPAVFGLFARLPTQVDTMRYYQGFDFSAGNAGGESDYYDRERGIPGTDDLGLYQLTHTDGGPSTPGYFQTPPGGDIVDIDIYPFNVIFRPPRGGDGLGFQEIIEGHTYAVWPLDGGLALMYVVEVGLWPPDPVGGYAGGAIANVVIEWMYAPEWMYGEPTAIQATSWGRLKSNIRRGP